MTICFSPPPFCSRVVGVVTRRNIVVKLFSIEVILNAVAINLMAFARMFADAAAKLCLVPDRRYGRGNSRGSDYRRAVFRRWKNHSQPCGTSNTPARRTSCPSAVAVV